MMPLLRANPVGHHGCRGSVSYEQQISMIVRYFRAENSMTSRATGACPCGFRQPVACSLFVRNIIGFDDAAIADMCQNSTRLDVRHGG